MAVLLVCVVDDPQVEVRDARLEVGGDGPKGRKRLAPRRQRALPTPSRSVEIHLFQARPSQA
jgi:hypothetical protein